MVCLVSNDGRRAALVSCTQVENGCWGRPAGEAGVRFLFPRSHWQYQ
jgi:hypothetical protein